MLVKEISTGDLHFIGKEDLFGVDTICYKELVSGEYIKVDGEYTKCTCEKCFDEIEKDLRKRPAKIEKRKSKNRTLTV